MRQNSSFIRVVSKLAVCALLLAGAAVRADDAKPADPTGSWVWSTPGRNGGPDRTNTLVLKVDSDKVTGKLKSPGRGGATTETAIADAMVKGDSISFNIVRERNGTSTTNKFTGKIAGDKITGTMEYTRNGDTQSRDWTATRAAADATADAK